MLRKVSSIMRIPSQLKSTSWLISVLVHVAVIIALREAYPAKTNHTNDELKRLNLLFTSQSQINCHKRKSPRILLRRFLRRLLK